MRLSVVIVSWNTRDLLRQCLDCLKQEVGCDVASGNCQVFVVDNNSHDGSAQMVKADHAWVKLIANDANLGFAKANNQAIKLTNSEYVLLLNPDTEVEPGAIKTLLQFIEPRPECGVVAPQLLNSDGSVQRSCREFPTFAGMCYELIGLTKLFPKNETFGRYKMLDWNHDDERQVDQPEGACLLIRRSLLDQVGLLDEGYFMLFEEVDWCYRVKRAGWQIWFTPTARVKHHYGQSIKQVKTKMILSSHRGLFRFWQKHYQGNRWYLSGIAYLGLMTLAYLRIFAYQLKAMSEVRSQA
jgi:GT2 family glycosyltransferase